MTVSNRTSQLRQGLLDSETTDTALRAEYQRRLKVMMEPQLSRPKKFWFASIIFFNAVGLTAALSLVLTEPLRPGVRAMLLACCGFAVAWILFFANLLRRGTLRRRFDGSLSAGMAFVFALIACLSMAIAGLPTDRVLLVALATVLPAGLLVVRNLIVLSELRTEERLVELQYRIAVLSERLGGDDDRGSPVVR